MADYNRVGYGPPDTGWFQVGDTVTDSDGTVFFCAKTGSPGLWSAEPPHVANSPANSALRVGAAPVVSGLSVSIERAGSVATLTFTLAGVQLAVTDAGVSGSYGTVKIFDFIQQAVAVLGARQDYTAFVEGAALTTGAGDASFVIGLGSTAIATAADGVLGATEDDIATGVSITDSGGTGAGTRVEGAAAALNGTGTAADINLNWSGTAATIDANSTIDVTGTITLVVAMLGDD